MFALLKRNLFIIIIFICSFKAINIYLRNENKDDPSEVVVDEFIGQSLPLIFLLQFNVYEVLLAFSSFRLFDILKSRLDEEKLNIIYESFEKPLVQILSQIEMNGIKINIDYLKKLSTNFANKINNKVQVGIKLNKLNK